MSKIREAHTKLTELGAQEAVLKKRSEDADAAVNEAMRELQKMETERDHIRSTITQLTRELGSRAKQLSTAESTLQGRKEEVVMHEKDIGLLTQQITDYQQEQRSELKAKLSEQERQELRDLSEREKTVQAQISNHERELRVVSEERDRLKVGDVPSPFTLPPSLTPSPIISMYLSSPPLLPLIISPDLSPPTPPHYFP